MTRGSAWAYGALGLPLAFAALPIYVHVPRYYAETVGLELTVLGAILLGTRLLDAFIDPWHGGLALPLLDLLGYRPGDAGGHAALVFAYALLPLGFKLLAATLLWRWRDTLEVRS